MKTNVYACYNRNEKIRLRSSSGGIYFLLAKEVLNRNGIVFAACYDGIDVKHKKIVNENELLESLGSKYIPSNMGETFAAVREELNLGKTVLFTGIPCQCAGLLAYLKGCKAHCTNLITLDVICHGIPSKKAWRSYCDSLKKSGFDVLNVNMRDKSSGWKNYSWKLTDSKGKSKVQLHDENSYMKGFISDIYLRPSCSICGFKGVERDTDITLGDYWGIQNVQPEMDDDIGTSLVFVHSEIGQKLFDAVSGFVNRTPALIEQAVKYNPSIIASSSASKQRTTFFRLNAKGEEFCKIIEEMTRVNFSTHVKLKIKCIIRKVRRGGG